MPSRPLDRTDRLLLAHLQNDARLSNKELAARLGLAPSTPLERTRRLEREGVLAGYHAAVDRAKVGTPLQALVAVQLRRHHGPLVEAFEAHALALPEVVQLFHTTGTSDFLIHVAVEDPEHLRRLALEAFTSRDEVSRIETSLLYEHRRSPAPLPE